MLYSSLLYKHEKLSTYLRYVQSFFGCLSANPFVLVLEGRASYMCRYELMGEVP